MIKFKVNKKTKKPFNSYSIISSKKKIGSYDQLNNTLRIDINEYVMLMSKGEKSSNRFDKI
jgi:hypothetical protein